MCEFFIGGNAESLRCICMALADAAEEFSRTVVPIYTPKDRVHFEILPPHEWSFVNV